MPDPQPDPTSPQKPALPARRPEGEKPRSFAHHTADPIGLPGTEEPLKPAPPDVVARRGKASLPDHRKKDRDLPAFTPAPYQAEPASGPPVTRRAELPGPRHADEHPKFRPPAPPSPPTPSAEPPTAGADVPATSDPATPARPTKHRFGTNRPLEMRRQGTVEVDPEINDQWGHAAPYSDTEKRGSRRLILWATLIGAPLIAFAIWQSLGRPGAAPPTPTPTPVAAPNGSSADAAEETRQAGEVIKQFLAATTIAERAALVRHPEITRPRMEAWYSAANPLKPQSVLDFHDRSAEQTIDEVTFLMLTMDLNDHSTRSIAVERQPDGRHLIDWESFVFWSDPRWPEFLSKEPAGAHEFRVSVEIDTYFNFEYADAKRWFCYKLNDPENWAHCWGYCSIDSEAGMKINRMIRRQRQQGQNQIKAILKLRFDEAGKGRNQVFIEDVVQDGWVKTGA